MRPLLLLPSLLAVAATAVAATAVAATAAGAQNADWPVYHGNDDHTHYSTLSQISPA
ncbi:MAG: hypothetical protein ING97_11555, partial [Gemmatimonas sp.]|nr:hypothetical protein [Gemmatimonas sp.]